jgi:hypothetical protein
MGFRPLSEAARAGSAEDDGPWPLSISIPPEKRTGSGGCGYSEAPESMSPFTACGAPFLLDGRGTSREWGQNYDV